HHWALAVALEQWAGENLKDDHAKSQSHLDAECRRLVGRLGDAGWLAYAVGGTAFGGSTDTIDTRAVCVIRETLARHSGLADFAFAMQGLRSRAISVFSNHQQHQPY